MSLSKIFPRQYLRPPHTRNSKSPEILTSGRRYPNGIYFVFDLFVRRPIPGRRLGESQKVIFLVRNREGGICKWQRGILARVRLLSFTYGYGKKIRVTLEMRATAGADVVDVGDGGGWSWH